jgi:hypothetical protein
MKPTHVIMREKGYPLPIVNETRYNTEDLMALVVAWREEKYHWREIVRFVHFNPRGIQKHSRDHHGDPLFVKFQRLQKGLGYFRVSIAKPTKSDLWLEGIPPLQKVSCMNSMIAPPMLSRQVAHRIGRCGTGKVGVYDHSYSQEGWCPNPTPIRYTYKDPSPEEVREQEKLCAMLMHQKKRIVGLRSAASSLGYAQSSVESALKQRSLRQAEMEQAMESYQKGEADLDAYLLKRSIDS